MILTRSTDPAWLSNACLVGDRNGGVAVVIDTGAPLEPLLRVHEERGLTLAAILCTHRHPDHVSGNQQLARRTGAAVFALRAEAEHVPLARPLDDGERRKWGGIEIRVIELAGHTAGQADPYWRWGKLPRIERRMDDGVRSASPGWWVAACHQGATGNTGSPLRRLNRLDQQARRASGRKRVAEGLVVPLKPGNSGGGKEPWFQGADGAARDGGDWR